MKQDQFALQARVNHPARRFAVVLPWLELALGLMLVLGVGTRVAAALSALLLFTFIFAVGINLRRGRKDLNCGCGGARHSQKIGGRLIARNLGLILLALPPAIGGQDHPLVAGWLGQGLAYLLLELVLAERGLPFALTLCGLLMLVLLGRQMRRLVHMEARR
ncbi:MAG: DoxX family membrane protein [Anaerolineales bacterium]|nr:DoxX family membrane protein [Anaerolineales bacterium]